jgi:hypothetical protein
MANRPKTISCWACEFLEISTLLLNISHHHCTNTIITTIYILMPNDVRTGSFSKGVAKCFQSSCDCGKWCNTYNGICASLIYLIFIIYMLLYDIILYKNYAKGIFFLIFESTRHVGSIYGTMIAFYFHMRIIITVQHNSFKCI